MMNAKAPTTSHAVTRLPARTPRTHRKYGPILRWCFRHLFSRSHFPETTINTLKELHNQGTIVHVVRGESAWIALFYNHLLEQSGLPWADFIGGTGIKWFQPVSRTLSAPSESTIEAIAPAHLSEIGKQAYLATIAGGTVFMLLPTPQPTLERREGVSLLEGIIEAQAQSDRPIFFVPQVLAEAQDSSAVGGSWPDRLLGHRRRLSTLRHIISLFAVFRNADIRCADPIDLKAYLATDAERTRASQARHLSHELNKRLQAEQRVIAGPELPAIERTFRQVLRDPELQVAISEEQERTGKNISFVEEKARKYLGQIAALYNVEYVRGISRFLSIIFNRIYDGISVDEPGLQRALDASRKGPLVFCPCHRSHIDYLVLSYTLWTRGITPPHIAAGANLSFFPLGPIFRRCGAFFLRRSFKDSPLYTAVFRAYVTELVRTSTSIEFFPEGTRSRTGKLLMPKFGILRILVDAWRRNPEQELMFVPVSVDYERIIEASAYKHELTGGDKHKESITGLIKSTQILRSRYGRVLLNFGEPISLRTFSEGTPDKDDSWRILTERLGFKLLSGINETLVATPTSVGSAALLAHAQRGLSRQRFLATSHALLRYLRHIGVPVTSALADLAQVNQGLITASERLASDGLLAVEYAGRQDSEPVFRVPEESRILVDYHKNGLMNHFAPGALLARSILAFPQDEEPVVREETLFLSRLFKREFVYKHGIDFSAGYTEASQLLIDIGYVHRTNNMLHPTDDVSLRQLAHLLDNFIEAYWCTACALRELHAFPMWQKELETRAFEGGRRAFLEGIIRRPEATSGILIKGALDSFTRMGVIRIDTRDNKAHVQLTDAYAEAELEKFITHLARFLAS